MSSSKDESKPRRSRFFNHPTTDAGPEENNNGTPRPNKFFKPLTTFNTTSVAAKVTPSSRSHKSEGHRRDETVEGVEIDINIEDDKKVEVVKSPIRSRQPLSNQKRHQSQPLSAQTDSAKGRKSTVPRRPPSALGDAADQPMENFHVGTRIRPPVPTDGSTQVPLVKLTETGVEVQSSRLAETLAFPFDHRWQSVVGQPFYGSQLEVYEKLAKPTLMRSVLEGVNACLFAYGQTGTGKTHSIMGSKTDLGILPRFCQELFTTLETEIRQGTAVVEICYYEIYCEQIRDLLSSKPPKSQPQFKVREHPVTGPYVENLSRFPVRSFEDLQFYLDMGQKLRTTAATQMNQHSSRSHAIFTLKITRKYTEVVDDKPLEYQVVNVVSIVDLAGSERADTSNSMNETTSINKSLSTLSKVIDELSKRDNNTIGRTHVSYRDSQLTWLLKESLGGNSRTAMLATVSPAVEHVSETLSTLRYASKARSIRNSVATSEDPTAALIKKLKMEIAELKTRENPSTELDEHRREVQRLREELDRREKEFNAALFNREAESRKKLAQLVRDRNDIGAIDCPILVMLTPDPMANDTAKWALNATKTKIGSAEGCDILLTAVRIADHQCDLIRDSDGAFWLKCISGDTYINGHLVKDFTSARPLFNGYRISLAAEYFFRLLLPNKRSVIGPQTTFEGAKAELFELEAKRLEKEKADERHLAQQEAQNLRQMLLEQNEVHQATLKRKEEEITRNLLQTFEEEKRAGSQAEKQLVVNKRESLANDFVANKQIQEQQEMENEEVMKAVDLQVQPQQHIYNQRRSLVQLNLKVEAVNQILKKLGKEFEMRVEDMGSSLVVFVKNTKMNHYCSWTVDTFNANYEVINEVYSNPNREGKRLAKILYTRSNDWQPCPGPAGKHNPLLSYTLANAMKTAQRRSSAARRSSVSPCISANSTARMSMSLNNGDVSFLSTTLMGELPEEPSIVVQSDPNFYDVLKKGWRGVEPPSCPHENGRFHRVLWLIRFLSERCETGKDDFISADDGAEYLVAFLFAVTSLSTLVESQMQELTGKQVDSGEAVDSVCDTLATVNTYCEELIKVCEDQENDMRIDRLQKISSKLDDLVSQFGTLTFFLVDSNPLAVVGTCRSCQIKSVMFSRFVTGLRTAMSSTIERRLFDVNNLSYSDCADVASALKETLQYADNMINQMNPDVVTQDSLGVLLSVVYPFVHLMQAEEKIIDLIAQQHLALRNATESFWQDDRWQDGPLESVCQPFVTSMERLVAVLNNWRRGFSSQQLSSGRPYRRFEAIPYELQADLTKISFDDSVNV